MVTTASTPVVPMVTSDRYPIHLGAATTVANVTAVLRLAEIGYRLQYVDLLADLVEGDPQARNALETRASAVSSRPWHMVPAKVEDERDEAQAQFIADWVDFAIRRIPRWRQHFHSMLSAFTYGVTCREVFWGRGRAGEYLIRELKLVHSRRLAYDWDWRLVWTVYGHSNEGQALDVYPGKFWTFEPDLCDEYTTRQGLGRTLAYWLAFKRFAVRDFLAFVERFGKPYPIATWRTTNDAQPRPADDTEIALAKSMVQRIGVGTMGGAAFPDTIQLALDGNGATANGSQSGENTPHKALIALCDEQVSKVVLGQAYTTNAGQRSGLGNSGDPFEAASQLKFEGDAAQACASVDRDIVYWLVKLNFGQDAAERLCPNYVVDIEDPEDGDTVAARMERLVKVGYPLPVEYVADRFQWPVPEPGQDILTPTGLGTYRDAAEREAAAAAMAEAVRPEGEPESEDEDEGSEDKG